MNETEVSDQLQDIEKAILSGNKEQRQQALESLKAIQLLVEALKNQRAPEVRVETKAPVVNVAPATPAITNTIQKCKWQFTFQRDARDRIIGATADPNG